MSNKEECWDIEVTAKMEFRFVFDRPVTKEEARDLVEAGEWEDIIDERDLEILSVIKVYG